MKSIKVHFHIRTDETDFLWTLVQIILILVLSNKIWSNKKMGHTMYKACSLIDTPPPICFKETFPYKKTYKNLIGIL